MKIQSYDLSKYNLISDFKIHYVYFKILKVCSISYYVLSKYIKKRITLKLEVYLYRQNELDHSI